MSDAHPGGKPADGDRPSEPADALEQADPTRDAEAGLAGPGEPVTSMTAEEARFAARLADDLSEVLRTGVMVEDLEIDHGRPVRIRVVCLIEGAVREISAEGSNVAEALGEVVRVAARMRLDAAWWQIVGPA